MTDETLSDEILSIDDHDEKIRSYIRGHKVLITLGDKDYKGWLISDNCYYLIPYSLVEIANATKGPRYHILPTKMVRPDDIGLWPGEEYE